MKKIRLIVIGLMLLGSMGWAADKPISQLPAVTTIENNDLFMISNYSAGSYFSRQLSFLNFKTKLDTFYQPLGQGGMVYPPPGLVVSTGEGWGAPATSSSIVDLFSNGTCSGYLKSDGSCDTPSGGGDMIESDYASDKKIKASAGGTGIDSSALSGFPRVTSGTWSVLDNAGVKSALGYLTSTDYPVTGVASPTAGMIPKWGVSGNTLVDGYNVTAFQAALTNPVTGVASPSAGYLTKWGLSGNSIVDGLRIGTMTDGKVCTFSDTDGMECDTTITGGGSMVYPSAGITVSTGEGWGSPATYSNITGLWASGACSGYLKSDGSCDTPSSGSGGYTNLTSFIDQTAWRLFYSDGSGDVKELSLGTNGQYLMSNGASAVPSWSTPSGGSGFDVAGNYTPTGVWNWGTVGAGTTWPTFNQSTTGNAATATTATNLSNYSVLYNGSMTDGHIVSYRSEDGKLQDAGAAVAYTQPASNLPLCRTGAGTVGACTYLTDAAAGGFDVTGSYSPTGTWNWSGVNAATTWPTFNQNTTGTAAGLTNYSVLYNGAVTDGNILAYNAADGKLRNAGFSYTQPGTNLPLCRTGSGTIGACSNLTDTDMSSIEGSADDIGVKIETISTDPEAVIECEGKDRNYIVGFNEPSFFQLPADPTGVRYCFGNNDYGEAISIVPAIGDTITHGGTATTSGQGLVSTGSAQDWVCLLGLSASKWRTISSLGTWSLAAVELPSEPEPPGGVYTDCSNIGTAAFYWNGDHTSGATYACTSSSTTLQGELLAGSHVDSNTDPGDESPESGGIVYKVTAESQRFRFGVTDKNIFDSTEGMLCADVYMTDLTGNNDIFNIMSPTYGTGQLQGRVDSSGNLLYYHRSSESGSVFITLTSTAAISAETWTRVCVRWSATNGDYGQIGIKIGANNWETKTGTESRPCTAWVNEPTTLPIAGNGTFTDTFYVDNVSISKDSGL